MLAMVSSSPARLPFPYTDLCAATPATRYASTLDTVVRRGGLTAFIPGYYKPFGFLLPSGL